MHKAQKISSKLVLQILTGVKIGLLELVLYALVSVSEHCGFVIGSHTGTSRFKTGRLILQNKSISCVTSLPFFPPDFAVLCHTLHKVRWS